MKKNILLFLISLFMAANAQAQEGCNEDACCIEDSCCNGETDFYVKFFGGANFLQNSEISENEFSYDTGYVLGGSLGYRFCYGLSLEAEYAYRRNDINKTHFCVEGSSKHGHYQASSYMANLLWNPPISLCGCIFGNIQPFIGVGIGYDFQRLHSSNCRVIFDQKWNHFSWQLMAGVAHPICYNTDITLEYKYHQGGCHFNNHSVGVGLVYKFEFLR